MWLKVHYTLILKQEARCVNWGFHCHSEIIIRTVNVFSVTPLFSQMGKSWVKIMTRCFCFSVVESTRKRSVSVRSTNHGWRSWLGRMKTLMWCSVVWGTTHWASYCRTFWISWRSARSLSAGKKSTYMLQCSPYWHLLVVLISLLLTSLSWIKSDPKPHISSKNFK